VFVLDGNNLSAGSYPAPGGALADLVVASTTSESIYTAPTIYASASGLHAAINVGNIGRALPSLVILAIGDAFLGLGLTVVELALVILAVPPIVTNAYLGVDGVDRDVVDAARGMGMSAWQTITRVELPLAAPLLFVGIRTAALFVVSTTTIAALAGFSGSLGDVIANETSYHFSGVLGAAICVAALALLVDAALLGVQRLLTPRGLRLQQRARAGAGQLDAAAA